MDWTRRAPKGLVFIMVSAVVLIASLIVAYQLQRSTLSGEGTYTFTDFLNDGKTMPSIEDATVGLVFGIVFGMMDTLGTWFGMQNINEVLPRGSPELKAAISGVYSNIMGLTMGTVVTLIVRLKVGTSDEQKPIWLNIIGIVLGSPVGVFIGKTFLS